MPAITDLPVELFLDNILPLLPNADLIHFGATSRLFYQLASDETLWHRKLQQDFNFSGADTARRTGWKFLYSRLAHPRLHVWGESTHGRLGMAEGDLPRSNVPMGVPFPVQLRIPGVRIVSLVASGMSFHALDSKGNVFVWGELDGSAMALRSDGFSEPCKRAERPMRLNLPVKFRSLSCGRLHTTALDASSDVWTFTSWGRPFRLSSPLLDKSSPDSTPAQIECGWAFSSVLTMGGDVLVFWPLGGRMHGVIERTNEELNETRPESRARPTKEEPDVIPCHWWVMQGVDPIRLPPIPANLPEMDTGLGERERAEETRVVKVAGMDNYLIALTNKGHVLRYDHLGGEHDYERGAWRFLPEFCDPQRIRANPAFAEHDIELPEALQITHISAHFTTFFAYTPGARSLVLMGKSDTPEPFTPLVLPALQNRGVIAVVLGDYHYGALTASGQLLTWGSFSKGALGLGEPTQLPVGTPGGFATEANRQAALRGRWGMQVPPPEVREPAPVHFGSAGAAREMFCFAAAAAGWHTGALVIDLDPDADEDADAEEAGPMPGAFPERPRTPPRGGYDQWAPGAPHILPFGRGFGPFRVGFAGRGAFGGRGRGGPRAS
ncbi:hypothetical protein CERSUDRAFT_112811 [Gelatoporia subvermispora B]|uniref:F-box domain-containing protein n=1 Tax=Ceriporiopsis subvermispora (strain B) TaxID=914234 RepID=M2RKX5_CERS8|nr:hypothetical protein CERSUDRAFT_112811 [Gelatoporia subvermispora B]